MSPETVTREVLLGALRRGVHRAALARELGVERTTVSAACKRHGIHLPSSAIASQIGRADRPSALCVCGEHGFVELTRGLVAMFSPEDLPLVRTRSWYAHVCPGGVYAKAWRLKVDGPGPKKIALHRLVLSDSDAPSIDHKDRDTLNNRRENLRPCSVAENTRNRRMKRRRQMGFKGVTRLSDRNFRASITAEGERIALGSFSTPEEAARAYDEAALRLHGQFALTNATLGLLPEARA